MGAQPVKSGHLDQGAQPVKPGHLDQFILFTFSPRLIFQSTKSLENILQCSFFPEFQTANLPKVHQFYMPEQIIPNSFHTIQQNVKTFFSHVQGLKWEETGADANYCRFIPALRTLGNNALNSLSADVYNIQAFNRSLPTIVAFCKQFNTDSCTIF